MDLDLILVPFHLDRKNVGTGLGPARLRAAGAEHVLADAGHNVRGVASIDLQSDSGETGNIFAIARDLAGRVSDAHAAGAAPIVFAGDCYNAMGVTAGLGAKQTGLAWFDAHGDANTPDTTESGFFDGFPLAVVVGWCWRTLAATLPGFEPLAEDRVLHIGGRAFEEQERALMTESAMNLVTGDDLQTSEGERLFQLGLDRLRQTDRVHVHFDLDVIDKSDGHASGYAVDGGPSLDDLERMIRAIGETCHVGSATICAYDPAFDEDDRASEAAMRMLRALGEVVR